VDTGEDLRWKLDTKRISCGIAGEEFNYIHPRSSTWLTDEEKKKQKSTVEKHAHRIRSGRVLDRCDKQVERAVSSRSVKALEEE